MINEGIEDIKDPIEVYRFIIKYPWHFLIDGKFVIMYCESYLTAFGEPIFSPILTIQSNSIQLKQKLIELVKSNNFDEFIIIPDMIRNKRFTKKVMNRIKEGS